MTPAPVISAVRATMLFALALLGGGLVPPAAVAGPVVFSSGELDLEVHYEGGGLGLGWHDHAADVGYGVGDVLVRFVGGSIVSRPADPKFGFLGVGPGEPVWVLPSVEVAGIVWPGISGEEIEGGVFDGDKVFLEITGIRGPGDFSIWDTDAFGDPDVLAATSDGLGGDVITILAGSHAHYNWALSRPGLYEIDVRAYGFIGGRLVEARETLLLEAQAVPEPGTLLAFGLLAVPFAVYRRMQKS